MKRKVYGALLTNESFGSFVGFSTSTTVTYISWSLLWSSTYITLVHTTDDGEGY